MNAFGFTDGFGYEAFIEYVIVGGESGPGARPMHPDWARSIRDQCQAADVPFNFKQWGEFVPDEISPDGDVKYRRIGKHLAGRTLDGKIHDSIPELGQERK
jgi:protein gp37